MMRRKHSHELLPQSRLCGGSMRRVLKTMMLYARVANFSSSRHSQVMLQHTILAALRTACKLQRIALMLTSMPKTQIQAATKIVMKRTDHHTPQLNMHQLPVSFAAVVAQWKALVFLIHLDAISKFEDSLMNSVVRKKKLAKVTDLFF